MNFINLNKLIIAITIITFSVTSVKATEECFEKTSRAIFKFNMAFDDVVLEPLAKGYNKLPNPIKTGTSNFTSNIGTLLSIPNNVLQGNVKQLGHSVGSFVVNTSVGILGFLNPAEKMGLKPHKEDVGQTLGSYGVGTGCYFVLPILGPTTARDTLGLIADSFVDPFAHITIREHEILGASGNNVDYFAVKGTTALDFRADNDNNFESLEKTSIDLYSSLKSIYLQDRVNKIQNSDDSQDEWEQLDN
jgi:phospholipid-binding lipoprotein MlaA|tara:strand:- start:645 stop:1385 length:741 start_codon:yes stop_codon:yes gene_type:complete